MFKLEIQLSSMTARTFSCQYQATLSGLLEVLEGTFHEHCTRLYLRMYLIKGRGSLYLYLDNRFLVSDGIRYYRILSGIERGWGKISYRVKLSIYDLFSPYLFEIITWKYCIITLYCCITFRGKNGSA